jgi:hypothetical protein
MSFGVKLSALNLGIIEGRTSLRISYTEEIITIYVERLETMAIYFNVHVNYIGFSTSLRHN